MFEILSNRTMILSNYFVCQLLHIICLPAFTRPQLKVYKLRKFARCGRYHSAIVQAAASQVVLRLHLSGSLAGSLRRFSRASFPATSTPQLPDCIQPVEGRSFATCQSPSLPLRFCLRSTPARSFFRFRLVAFRRLQASRLRSLRRLSGALLRQPQVGQTVGGCQSCNIKITVFDITRNYRKHERKSQWRVRCVSYNRTLCQIRGAHCKPLKAFSVLFRGAVHPTHPPAKFFFIVHGFLMFTQLNSISYIIVLRTSTLKNTAALRLAPAASLSRLGTTATQRYAPATPSSHREAIRPLCNRLPAICNLTKSLTISNINQ